MLAWNCMLRVKNNGQLLSIQQVGSLLFRRESAALTIQIWWRMMSSHLKILRAVRMQDKFKKIAGMAHTLKGDGDEMVDAAWK